MLMIFDVEGVLVDGEFLPEVARLVGKEGEVAKITLQGIRGEIPWEEGLLRRIELLKGISFEDAKRVSDALPLMPGAKELLRHLKERGWRTIAVSGGFSLLTDRLKRELGLDYTFSNELLFEDGRLAGVRMSVTSNKADAVQAAMVELGEERSSTVAVVDGANDLKLFQLAGIRVAFNAQPIVEERADLVIRSKDLRELIRLLPHLL